MRMRSPVRRPAAIALAALTLTATVGVGCSSEPPRAAVVGDSITRFMQDQLADSGSEARWDVAATGGATAAEMERDARDLASRSPDQAVVNLGTNDALEQVPVDQTVASLESIVDGFSDAACIHLVTISTALPPFGDPPAAESAAGINDWIRQTAEDRDDVQVIDWDRDVRRDGADNLLIDDHIHPNGRGIEHLTRRIVESVESC